MIDLTMIVIVGGCLKIASIIMFMQITKASRATISISIEEEEESKENIVKNKIV